MPHLFSQHDTSGQRGGHMRPQVSGQQELENGAWAFFFFLFSSAFSSLTWLFPQTVSTCWAY